MSAKAVVPTEDPGITRLDIDRYRRSLSSNLDAAARAKTLELIAEAEARLAASRPPKPGTPSND